jgi:glycosidase
MSLPKMFIASSKKRALALILFLVLSLGAALLLPFQSAQAQFASPAVDGVIGSNEYGVHTDGQNQQSTGTGQTWYMTWDDTNLYVAVTNANLSEGAVIYIDKDPISPVNGGTNANGNLTGNNYDNTNFAHLPFRADYVTYFKDGYREFRKADGAGGWSGATAFSGAYASNGTGNVRELSIPWSDVTGGSGRPASFLFFGYVTSSGGYVYGQVPQSNPGTVIGTAADYSHYYTVNSTANGASTKPFSIESTSPTTSSIDLAGFRHDTFDGYYRSPFGAVPAGTPVTLRFRTAHFGVDGVSVRVYSYDPATDATTGPTDYPLSFLENRTENSVLYDIWSGTLATPSTPAIFYYKFRVTKGADVAFYSDSYADDHDNLNQGGEGEASQSEPFPAFQLTIYDANFQTPDWLKNANVYQIFPDRFRNGDINNDYCRNGCTASDPVFYGNQSPIAHTTWNEAICDPRQPAPCPNEYGTQFFGGDLKGIQDKLDYLQSLGIDTIYMTPIFKARSNHRYDTDNYLEVDPALGGDAALASLKTQIDARGMHLIFDGVFNHSSSDSLYFDRYHRYSPPDGGCESTSSPYRTWYNFFNNNAPCTSSDYEAWAGFDSLPAFKDDSTDVRDFIYRNPTDNVVKHWYARGAGGWRFDVATDISHNWWHDFRPFAKGYKADGPLIGEIFPDASQWLAGDQLDSAMNYRFRRNVLGFARGALDFSDNDNSGNDRIIALAPSQFDHALKAVREDYPPQSTATMLNLLDSHDTSRALFVLTEPGDTGLVQAKVRLKLSALFQFTYPGAPMVYYGDEGALNSPSIGSGPNGPEDDPYNRAPYPWADESGNPNVYGPIDNSVLDHYTRLANLRKQHPALRTGTFETILTGDTTPSETDNNTYAFARVLNNDKAIVLLNNGAGSNTVTIPVAAYFTEGTPLVDVLSNTMYSVSDGTVTLSLAASSGALLFAAPPTAADARISGQITTGDGSPLAGVVVSLNGSTKTRRTITDSLGRYSFEGVETKGFYTVTPSRANYTFGPAQLSFSLLADKTDALFTASQIAETLNPLDTPEFFVRQQYIDFLGREPDAGGLAYWTTELERCGGDAACLRSRHIGVSAAFFIEQEFQQTGFFVYRLYKGALGRQVSYQEFSNDRQQVIGGSNLEANRAAFADAFVQRPEFTQKYRSATTAVAFVDAFIATMRQTSGIDVSGQRESLIDRYNSGGNMNQSRSLALQILIEDSDFKRAEYNKSFVLMQYFGYLRRDPEQAGYQFWLNVLDNKEPGNYSGMVCSFITSTEYQQRFSSVVSHSNRECR